MEPTNLNADQLLRMECLRLCSGSVAEAKNAYFWLNEQAQKQKNLGGLNQVNTNMQTFGGNQSQAAYPVGPITHGSGTKC